MKYWFLTSAFAILGAGISSADGWPEGRALITCYPGAGLFELQSHPSYPDGIAPEFGPATTQRTYSPDELGQDPFICKLPGSEIIVEGRNNVTGKGPCGARLGAEARITVNGEVVAHTFESINGMEQLDMLSMGWIELSECFGVSHTVKIQSTDEFTEVELCRISEGETDTSTWLTPVSGTCKFWPGYEDTYRKK